MKKFLSVLIVLVMTLLLSFTLVACVKPKAITYETVFEKIGEAMPEGTKGNVTNIVFEVPNGEGKDAYTLSIGSKFAEKPNDQQFAIKVMKGNYKAGSEEVIPDSEIPFAIYVAKGKLFLQLSETKVCLDDVDANYLVNTISKVADIDAILGKIGGLVGMEGLSLDMIVPLLFTLLEHEAMMYNEGNTEVVQMKINAASLLNQLLPMLDQLGIDGVISGALRNAGLQLPPNESETPFGDLINQVIALIPIGNLVLEARITDGVLDSLGVDYVITEEGEKKPTTILETTTTMLVSETGDINVGVPSDVSNYISFSLTNIAFDIDLKARADEFDAGKFVNLILGYNELPTGMFIVDAKNTNFRLSFKFDLDLHDNQKNLASIELFRLDDNNQAIGDPMLGLYYINGVLKINISELVSGLNVPNIVVTGIDITSYLQQGINYIDGIIQNFLNGMTTAELNNAVATVRDSDSELAKIANGIIPVTIASDGSSFVGSLAGIFFTALETFGFDNASLGEGNELFNLITDDNGNVTGLMLQAGEAFYDQLDSMLINDDAILVPEVVRPLTAKLIIDWSSGTLDSIAVNGYYDMSKGTDKDKIEVDLSLRNFDIGFVNEGLYKYIADRTSDTKYEYSDNLKDIIEGALDGIKLKAQAEINLKAGTYDISGMLAGFGVNIPGVKFRLDKEYILNAELSILLDYNADAPKTSRLAIELKLLEGSNFPFGTPGKNLLGVYSENGTVYVDLSNLKVANITLPKVKADIDVMSLLANVLNGLDVDLTLDTLLGLINGNAGNGGSADGKMGVADQNATPGIDVDLDLNDKLQITATSLAIQKLFSSFGLDFTFPTFDVALTAGGDKIVRLDLSLLDDEGAKKADIALEVTAFSIGKELDSSEFTHEINPDDYTSRVDIMLKQLLYNVDLQFNLSMKSANTILNITNILNNALAKANQRIDFPINLNLDNLDEVFTVNIKWSIDENNHSKTEALFEIYSKEFGNYIYGDGTEKNGFFIGAYFRNNALYVNLSQLGLFNVKVPGIDITKYIIELIDGIEGLNGLDLSDMLGDLLPKPTNNMLAQASAYATTSDVTNNVSISGMNGLLESILNYMLISDNGIFFDFIKENGGVERFAEFLRTFGIDIDTDVSGEVLVDFVTGKINLEAQIEDAEIGVNLNINNIGNKFKVEFSNHERKLILDEKEYSVWAGTTPVDIIMQMFNTLSPNDILDETNSVHGTKPILAIDMSNLNNFNSDKSGKQNTFIDIRKATRDFTAADKSAYSLKDHTALKGDYVVRVFKVDAGYASKTCILVAVVSIKRGYIYIQGTEGFVNAISGAVTGRIIKIEIPLDLEGMLANIPGFTDPVTEAGMVADSTNGDAAPTINFGELITGIDVTLRNDSSLNVSANLYAKSISDFLITTLDELFKGLVLNTSGGKPVAVGDVNYDTAVRNGYYYTGDWGGTPFMEDLFSFVKRYVEAETGLSIGFVVGLISDDYFDAIARLLPLPEFETANVQLNIVNGGVNNVRLETWDTPGVNNPQKLKLNITNSAENDEIIWGDLGDTIVYDHLSDDDLIERLNNARAIKYDMEPNLIGTHSRVNKAITYTVYTKKPEGSNQGTLLGNGNISNLKDAYGSYKPGTYYLKANAHGVDKFITLVIKNDGGGIDTNKKADPIVVTAYSELPTSVWATAKNGEKVLLKNVTFSGIDKSKFEIKEGSDPNNPTYIQKDVTVNAKNARLLIDIEFLPRDIEMVDEEGIYAGIIELDAFDFDSNGEYNNVLPKFITVKVKEGGYYRTIKVDSWVYDGLKAIKNLEQWISGGIEVDVFAKVNTGKYNEDTYTYKVKIVTSNIESVMFSDNNPGVLSIDPYQWIKYQKYVEVTTPTYNEDGTIKAPALYPNAPKIDNPYPSVATVAYGKDGVIERYVDEPISWSNTDGIRYDLSGFEGKGVVTVNPNKDTGSNRFNQTNVTIKVSNKTPKAVIFGTNNKGENITVPTINPFNASSEELNEIFKNNMQVVLADNAIMDMNIEWDISNISKILTSEGGTVLVKATIKPSYKVKVLNENDKYEEIELLDPETIKAYTSVLNVPVVVEKVGIKGIAYSERTYTVNNIGKYFYNNASLESLLPKKLGYITDGNKIIDINTTYELGSVSPSINGGEYTIKAVVVCGTEKLKFDYIIKTPNRANPSIGNTININYHDYLLYGDEVFGDNFDIKFGASTENLAVTWNTNNVNFINNTGYVVMYLGDDSTKYRASLKVNVNINNAPNVTIDKMPISTAFGYDKVVIEKENFDPSIVDAIFEQYKEWKLSFLGGDVVVDDIKWFVGDLDASKDNQTVKLVVYKDGCKGDINNALASFDIKVVFN